jgi:L-ascorbate metabolism protein UlaG (beta-lactamase superfamily)
MSVTLEYIAHSCFIVVSPTGTRIVIDPYNEYRWLGYEFPARLRADGVLISHPHYDHNASYYFPGAPVFQRPGQYSVGDVRLAGVPGKHAGSYGKEFGQTNTLWIVETGGMRIAHLGDNGALTPEQIRALGHVGVLMLPVDSREHILHYDEIEAIRRVLQPKVTIPMHYQIPSLSDLPALLGPIDPWLEQNKPTIRWTSHRAATTPDIIRKANQIWLLQPSPEVRAWSPELREAYNERARAGSAADEDAIAHLRRAVALAPQASIFAYELGRQLAAKGWSDDAIATLEGLLSRADRMDREITILSRALLAGLYRQRRRNDLAAIQYRIVSADSDWLEPRQQAEEFLQKSSQSAVKQ